MRTEHPTLTTLASSKLPPKANLVKRGEPETQRFAGKDLREIEVQVKAWLQDNKDCCGEPIFRIGRGYKTRVSFADLSTAIAEAGTWPEEPGNFVLTIICNKHD